MPRTYMMAPGHSQPQPHSHSPSACPRDRPSQSASQSLSQSPRLPLRRGTGTAQESAYLHLLVRTNQHKALEARLTACHWRWTGASALIRPFQYTLLHAAAALGHVEVARAIIRTAQKQLPADKCQAYLNQRTVFGTTALMIATEAPAGYSRRCALLTDALLHAGADVNMRDNYGNTALMRGVRAGNVTVVNKLTRHGADKTVRNLAHQDCVDLAMANGNAAAAAQLAGRNVVLVPGFCSPSVRDLRTVLATLVTLGSCIASFVTDVILAFQLLHGGGSSAHPATSAVFIFTLLPSVVVAILPHQTMLERILSLCQLRMAYEVLVSMSSSFQRLSVRFGVLQFLTNALEDIPQLILQTALAAAVLNSSSADYSTLTTTLMLSLIASWFSCSSGMRSMYLQWMTVRDHKPETESNKDMLITLLYSLCNVALRVASIAACPIPTPAKVAIILVVVMIRWRIVDAFADTEGDRLLPENINRMDPLACVLYDVVYTSCAPAVLVTAAWSTIELLFLLVLPVSTGWLSVHLSWTNVMAPWKLLLILGSLWIAQASILIFYLLPLIHERSDHLQVKVGTHPTASTPQVQGQRTSESKSVLAKRFCRQFLSSGLFFLSFSCWARAIYLWSRNTAASLCGCGSSHVTASPTDSGRRQALLGPDHRYLASEDGDEDEGEDMEKSASPNTELGCSVAPLGSPDPGTPASPVSPTSPSSSTSLSLPSGSPARADEVNPWSEIPADPISELTPPPGCWQGWRKSPHIKLLTATLVVLTWMSLQAVCYWYHHHPPLKLSSFDTEFCSAVGFPRIWSYIIGAVLYLLYLFFTVSSSCSQYLRGFRDISGVFDGYLRSRGQAPSLVWRIECYHYVQVTTTQVVNGVTTTNTTTTKSVTHRASMTFRIDSWLDLSEMMPADHQCVRLEFVHKYSFADAYTRKCYDTEKASFKAANKKDTHQDFSEHASLGQIPSALAIREGRISAWMRFPYFILCSLILGAVPFAMWVSACSTKQRVRMFKQIKRIDPNATPTLTPTQKAQAPVPAKAAATVPSKTTPVAAAKARVASKAPAAITPGNAALNRPPGAQLHSPQPKRTAGPGASSGTVAASAKPASAPVKPASGVAAKPAAATPTKPAGAAASLSIHPKP